MIYVKLNEDNFEYDIYSLVKAFYPKEEVKIGTGDAPGDEEILFTMDVKYADHKLTLDGREIEIDYYVYNPFFERKGDFTYDIDIDLSVPQNAQIYGHILYRTIRNVGTDG